MASGDTKTQQYLRIAAEGSRSDLPTDTCCNTKTQDLILDVAERIITEEETRAREDAILQGEIDEIKNNPDVYDIVPTYAALQAYDTSGLTDKDIIRVLSDETHDGASTYYRWSTSTETFTYIGEVGDYYTKTQVNNLIATAPAFKPYPSGVNTTGTTAQFISSIQALDLPVGSALLGTVELSDLPASLIQEEVQVYVYDNNLVYCIMYSADASPYMWWCNSYDYRGWEPMMSGGGGGATELTSADYNWPVSNPDGFAYWLLDPGFYVMTSDMKFYYNANDAFSSGRRSFLVTAGDTDKTALVMVSNSRVLTEFKNEVATGAPVTGWPVNYLNGDNIQSSTGTSSIDVMSQNAVTSMIYKDPAQKTKISLGNTAQVNGGRAVAIGAYSNAAQNGAIALGAGAYTSAIGEMNIGASSTSYGYNSSNYRLLTGLYDPQSAHDAATKGYVDTAVASAGAPVYTNSSFNTLWENA